MRLMQRLGGSENIEEQWRTAGARQEIRCPVVAIQGDYDAHPAEGIRKPLSRVVKDFRFILIEKCGHYPWMERQAKDKFYEILKDEIK